MREYEMANNRRKTENVKRSKRKWGGWIMILICCAVAAAAAIKFNEMMLEQWGVPAPAIPSSAENRKGNREEKWHLRLVNPWHTLPEGDTPELVKVKGGEYVDKRIYAALTSMLEAAQENGFEPNVLSGYRTYEQQQAVMEEKIAQFREQGYTKEEAKQLAEQWVAVPGTSEHQLGLAVDIEGNSYDIFPWLEQNSYRYGFIYRYPPDKTDITGISNEPWHFRYVGVQAATEMYEKGLCLEEYLETKK